MEQITFHSEITYQGRKYYPDAKNWLVVRDDLSDAARNFLTDELQKDIPNLEILYIHMPG